MPIKFDLESIRTEHNLSTFFETGLYHGASVQKAFDAGFTKAVSIEISEQHIERGKLTFADQIADGKCVLVHDDSQNIGDHLNLREGFTFYWLDAHADQGPQHAKGLPCPLYHELTMIGGEMRSGDVIAIDDMRMMGDSAGWGRDMDITAIRELVESIGEFDITFVDGYQTGDVMLATPKKW